MDMDFTQEDYGLIADPPEDRAAGPYSKARFLHAASGYGAMNINVEDTAINELDFGSMSSFNSIAEGFAAVTISSSRMPRIALFRRNLLFSAGSILTIVVVNSPHGIDVKIIPEL